MRNILRDTSTPLFHCITALVLGSLLLFSVISMDNTYRFVTNIINKALYYPELPVLKLRNFIHFSENWILERETLNERVKKLEIENRMLLEMITKNNIKIPAPRENYIYASVTLRHPKGWWREIRIDKGEKDGVLPGSAVTANGSLVGKVIQTGEDYSWVQLITSASFLLPVAVNETRDLCILTGDDKGNLKLVYLPLDRRITKGMGVSTSLMNDQIPPSLPVGTVLGNDKNEDDFQVVRISAGAHMTQIYGVEVYTPRGEM